MSRDPFAALVGPPPVIREANMRQLKAASSIDAYAKHGIASPDLTIADPTKPFIPLVVGDDGQAMTLERRQQLMVGRPTLLEISQRPGADYDYRGVPIDIAIERLGEAAEKARLPWRLVKAKPLVDSPELAPPAE